ncbi:hypothetical protein PV318_03110 [Streptomyces sp. ME02-6991-2B]|nr:hypothetical protein [Streptomyces sp. ME02-6991-2B]
MFRNAVVAITIIAAAALTVIIGLTMQATAYVLEGTDTGPGVIGLALTTAGVIAAAADAPLLLSVVRTRAHDRAYLTYLSDQQHNHAITHSRIATAPVLPLERRTP